MDELKQTTLKTPFKSKSNDSAVLASLIGELNSKNNVPLKRAKINTLVGTPPPYDPVELAKTPVTMFANLPPTTVPLPPMKTEEIQANEIIMQTEMAKAESVENIPVAAQRAAAKEIIPSAPVAAPPAPIVAPARMFVTGHPGAIDTLLDGIPETTTITSLSRTVEDILKATCLLAGNPPPATLLEFRKFGDGEFQPTLANVMILGIIRRTYPTFGSLGFWAKVILSEGFPSPGPAVAQQLVVVGVRTTAEFKALQEAGFSHYHVMATPQRVQQRTPKGYNNALAGLAQALDQDVHKKVSAQRTGGRLNVVWNDSAAPVSGRFISAPEFKQSVLGVEPTVVGSDSVSQIL